MTQSRLSRRYARQSLQSLFFYGAGMIVIVVLLLKFGIPFLANFTSFVTNSKNTTEVKNQDSATFVPPPVFDSLPTATNSAHIFISGNATFGQTVSLYINGEMIDKMEVGKDGKFVFSDVKINQGQNSIKSKATNKENKQSAFSQISTVSFKNTPPKLSVDSPSEGQSFSKDDKTVSISGKTDSGAKVTINDLWAIVDQTGAFSYSFPLQKGENKIKVAATDDAGNKSELERKVTYSD